MDINTIDALEEWFNQDSDLYDENNELKYEVRDFLQWLETICNHIMNTRIIVTTKSGLQISKASNSDDDEDTHDEGPPLDHEYRDLYIYDVNNQEFSESSPMAYHEDDVNVSNDDNISSEDIDIPRERGEAIVSPLFNKDNHPTINPFFGGLAKSNLKSNPLDNASILHVPKNRSHAPLNQDTELPSTISSGVGLAGVYNKSFGKNSRDVLMHSTENMHTRRRSFHQEALEVIKIVNDSPNISQSKYIPSNKEHLALDPVEPLEDINDNFPSHQSYQDVASIDIFPYDSPRRVTAWESAKPSDNLEVIERKRSIAEVIFLDANESLSPDSHINDNQSSPTAAVIDIHASPKHQTVKFAFDNYDNNDDTHVDIDVNHSMIPFQGQLAASLSSLPLDNNNKSYLKPPKSSPSKTLKTSYTSVRKFLSSGLSLKSDKKSLSRSSSVKSLKHINIDQNIEDMVLEITRQLINDHESFNIQDLSDNEVVNEIRLKLDDFIVILMEFWKVFQPIKNGSFLSEQERDETIEALEDWMDLEMDYDIDEGEGMTVGGFIEWLENICDHIIETRILNNPSIPSNSDKLSRENNDKESNSDEDEEQGSLDRSIKKGSSSTKISNNNRPSMTRFFKSERTLKK
jgi:hypothetical protein